MTNTTEIKSIKSKKLEELCKAYDIIARQSKELELKREQLKKQLLEQVKDFEKVQCKNWLISSTMTKDSEGTLITPDLLGTYIGARKGYKMLRVTNSFVGVEL